MTDKIGDGDTCQYLPDGKSGTCFSNYHSCANVRINGQISRDDLVCEQLQSWPYRNLAWDMYTQEESEEYWTVLSDNPPQLELITNGGSSNETFTSMPSPAPTGTVASISTINHHKLPIT